MGSTGTHQENASTSRTSRRTALLGALGAAGAALVAGGVAVLNVRSLVSPRNAPSEIPPGPLPDFTWLPPSGRGGTVAERDLPTNAKLYLLIRNDSGSTVSTQEWIPITAQGYAWGPVASTVAIGWLTPDEASELRATGIDSIQPFNTEAIELLQHRFGRGPVVAVTRSDQDTIAAHWQRRFGDRSQVRVQVVEGEPPLNGIGEYPAAGQVLIQASDQSLQDVIEEMARDADVQSISWGGPRMEFFCPPCGQG
jgi:hypothetical protein